MNTRLFKSALLLIPVIALFTSCNNKVSDSTPKYLRGGNSIVYDGTNLIVAGYNASSSKGYEAALLKINPTNGDTLWTKSFGSYYSDAFFCVKKSNDIAGGYIATGFSNNANGGSPSMYVVKTDKDGKSIFAKTYGSSSYTEGFSIVPNSESGYLISGFIQKSTNSGRDIFLERIGEDGAEIWSKSYGAKGSNPYDTINEVAYAAMAAPGGGYYVTGAIKGGISMEGGKIFLMKVAENGDSLWTKNYGSGFGYSITLTKDGNIAISGSKVSGSNQDVFLLKTDLSGNLLFTNPSIKTFGGTGFEYGATMIETSDGGFAITGITESVTNGLQDIYFVKTNATGGLTFEKNYGGSDNEQGYGLVQVGTDFYITGLSNTGGSYIYLNKVDMNGGQVSGWPVNIE